MSDSLKEQERQDILTILNVIYAGRVDFSRQRHLFGQETLMVIEEVLEDLIACNAHMKRLATDLIGAAALGRKGWLRSSLTTLARKMKKADIAWNGLGCRNALAAYRRSQIQSSFRY